MAMIPIFAPYIVDGYTGKCGNDALDEPIIKQRRNLQSARDLEMRLKICNMGSWTPLHTCHFPGLEKVALDAVLIVRLERYR